MCIICVLINKDKITSKEARRALWEQVQFIKSDEELEHIQEIYAELEKELDSE